MQSLFWKIFFWFWGAMVLIGLALFLFVLTTRPDPLPAPWRETASSVMHAYSTAATQNYRNGGQAALAQYLDGIGRRSHAAFWLFDESGRELSGLPIPPPLPEPGLLPPPDEPPDAHHNATPHAMETAQVIGELERNAAQQDATIFRLKGPRVLLAQRLITREGKSGEEKFVLAGSMPQPHFGRIAADPRRQVLGAALLLALSTLVCYGLVRYLTAPLIELREATRRLAAGDLTARTGAAARRRRDEAADLGRDFDAMAERLETLMASQRRLLGDVSHELRSPLARLSMALGLARRHAQNGAGAELEEDFNRIGREKERLNELIGQLLELVRLESGEYSAPRERIDLENLVREIAEDADFEARAGGKEVLVTHTAPCHVLGARELLQSAVENVVRNALAYTASESAVEISLEEQGEYCVLRVRDHGAGVPEAALEKLFEPFYRVATARDRQSGGVGLGLAITQRAVHSHGGNIIARNAPGGGLEIEMRLPCARSTPAASSRAA